MENPVHYLKVNVTEGLFSTEYSVNSFLSDGSSFSCFVMRDKVKTLPTTKEDKYNALMVVRVLDVDGDNVLISLPTLEVYYDDTFKNLNTVLTVKKEQLVEIL